MKTLGNDTRQSLMQSILQSMQASKGMTNSMSAPSVAKYQHSRQAINTDGLAGQLVNPYDYIKTDTLSSTNTETPTFTQKTDYPLYSGDNQSFKGVQQRVYEAASPYLDKYDLSITSGYRDPKHNADVGGAKNSQHMHGTALDINWGSLSEADRINLLNDLHSAGFKGFGVGQNTLHADMRDTPGYWGYFGTKDQTGAGGYIPAVYNNVFTGWSKN